MNEEPKFSIDILYRLISIHDTKPNYLEQYSRNMNFRTTFIANYKGTSVYKNIFVSRQSHFFWVIDVIPSIPPFCFKF